MDGLDITGLDELAAVFEHAPPHAAANVIKAGHVFGGKVKNIWRTLDSGFAHAPRYPYSISYDLDLRADGIEVEVGPDKSMPQGALGNLIEYGSSHNPPHGSGAKALAVAVGDLERGVTLAMEQAL